jgi:hypothetical protein
MTKRPPSITLIGWLFLVFGCVGVAVALWPLADASASGRLADFRASLLDAALAGSVRLAAAVGGAFLLRGRDWARWLLIAWMVFHIGLSFLHSMQQVLVHSLLFGAIGYVLFRTPASAYFRASRGSGEAIPGGGQKVD